MKKLLAILCVLAMLSMLCVPAMAYEGLNSLAIVGAGIPGVGEWNPGDAAGDMTETEDGIFVKEITLTAGTTMTFKFAGNDEWNDSFNFGSAKIEVGKAVELTNGNGAQNMTITVDQNTTLKFTVDVNPMADGGNATLLVEGDGIGQPPAPSYDKLSLMGSGADALNWDTGNAGNEMHKNGDVFTKVIAVKAGANLEIKLAANNAWDVNFGGGAIAIGETADLVANGNNMTLTVDEDCNLKFTVDLAANTLLVEKVDEAADEIPKVPDTPSTPATIEKLSLMGSGADALNWDTGNAANEMAKNGSVFTKTIAVKAGNLEIKFAANNSWDVNFGGGAITIGQTVELVPTGENMTLTVDADCNLKFTVDTAANTLLVEKVDNSGNVTETPDATNPTEPGDKAEDARGGNNTILIIVIVAVVVVAAAVAAVFVFKKKK